MPERDFLLLRHYAVRRMLPMRRMEMHLAKVCQIIAATNGNGEVTLADFLFDPAEPEPDVPDKMGGNVLSYMAGVGVHRLGQGRKKKE